MNSPSIALIGALLLSLTACGGGGGTAASSGGNSGGAGGGSSGTSGGIVADGSTSGTVGAGGAGNQPLTLTMGSATLTATAAQGKPAPTSSVTFDVSGLTTGQVVYIRGRTTGNGISRLALGTSLPSALLVTFKDPSDTALGTYTDSIEFSVCRDQDCLQQVTGSPQTVQVSYTVSPATSLFIASISPASVPAAGAPFVLTLNGANFSSVTTVKWNNEVRPTTLVSSTQLTARITAADIASIGTASISAEDNTPAFSNRRTLNIVLGPLTTRKISPASVTAGSGAFTLTVLGTGFTPAATVMWNGQSRPTTYVSSGELLAQVAEADVQSTGTAQVTVVDSTNAPGSTAAKPISIVAASREAVALQINAAHTGAISFNNVTLPASLLWSVSLGGTPTHALIAQGMVFVTVMAGGGNVVNFWALSQADGHVVWGPVRIPYGSDITYDSGKVFAVKERALTDPYGPDLLVAMDPANGQTLWSVPLPSGLAFHSPPAAANDSVFIHSSEGSGLLLSLDQADGALLWIKNMNNGSSAIPAVTADGVYVTYPCQTYAVRPATGEILWTDRRGCSGSGGGMPSVVNGLVYSPDLNAPSGYGGWMLNAATGAVLGAYAADGPAAFTRTTRFVLQGSVLKALPLGGGAAQWSFAGDGLLQTSPIIVNDFVFVGSSAGKLYAVSAATGQSVWQQNLPGPLPAGMTSRDDFTRPPSGLAAGNGLLVVPAGSTISAYQLSTQP